MTPNSQRSQHSGNIGLNDINLNEDDVQEQHKGRSHWQWEEDRMLISAWLNVSTDPITGADQKSERFWDKILLYCQENSPGFKRGLEGIKKRWTRINKEANRFGGCYEEASRNFRSGSNEEDKLADARQIYCTRYGSTHCNADRQWIELRHFSKWQAQFTESGGSKRCKVNAAGEYTSSSNVETSVGDTIVVNSPVRPKGTKAAKKKGKKTVKKGSHKDDIYLEQLQSFEKRHEEKMSKLEAFRLMQAGNVELETRKMELEARKIELEERKMAMEEKKEKDRQMMDIIFKDTSTMDERARELHAKLVKRIMQKYDL